MKKYALIIFALSYISINAQWSELNISTNWDLNSVTFINENEGWVCGDRYTVFHTTNGGIDWIDQTINSQPLSHLQSIYFKDDMNGRCSGTNGKSFITSDGGNTWTEEEGYSSTTDLVKVAYGNDITAWIMGDGNNEFWRITPSGIDEMNPGNSSSFSMLDIYCLGDTVFTLYYYSSFYLLGKTFDNGETWEESELVGGVLTNRIRKDIFFINNNHGWIGGSNGEPPINYPAVDKVINQGDSVANIYNSTEYGTGSADNLFFIDEDTGWMSNNSFPVLKTIDGGYSWYRNDEGISGTEINEIFFVNENIGYAVGTSGKIYKTTNGGGIVSVEDEQNLLNEFSLSQNYPNPFNPSTIISFSLPENNSVSLKVYNSLGEEVTVLLNKEMQAGEHQIKFNAKGLSSGIYFYTLTTGNFIETKKLILLR